MHGRVKSTTPPSAEEVAKREAKVGAYRALLRDLRSHPITDAAADTVTARLVQTNPDHYTAWNMRKEITNIKLTATPDTVIAVSASELELSSAALMKNPKCYAAWHHRVWVLDHLAYNRSQEAKDLLTRELSLCDKMLQLDARNFHCWNYRREVAKRAHASDEDELKFCSEKINEDFSNYSAWHYRTVLIARLHPPQSATRWSTVQSEFGLVRQAFYVEPADQSAWLYHRWLLAIVAREASKTAPVQLPVGLGFSVDEQPESVPVSSETLTLSPSPLEVFERELNECRELDAVEPDCKWVLLTIALLLAAVDAVRGSRASIADQAEIFDRLRSLDPMRATYYIDMQKSIVGHSAS